MRRSDQIRRVIVESCGDLDRFLARPLFGLCPDAPRTTEPVVEIVTDDSAEHELRLAASRALIDLAVRAALSGESARQLAAIAVSQRRSDLRLNCALVVLHRRDVDRDGLQQAIDALEGDRDTWVAAVARASKMLRGKGEEVLSGALSVLGARCHDEIAAALFLLQDAAASESIFSAALDHSSHNSTRVRIAATRLAILQAIRLCGEIARKLATTMSQRKHDSSSAVRSLLASLLGLFPNGAQLVKEITCCLEADSDSIVRAAMQARWTKGRLMEFPDE